MISSPTQSIIAGGVGLRVLLLSAASAWAQTFDVKQLDVTQGALELGLDNTLQGAIKRREDNRSAHDQSLDYGVTNWWRLCGVVKLEDPP
jgi:hypothetical protein